MIFLRETRSRCEQCVDRSHFRRLAMSKRDASQNLSREKTWMTIFSLRYLPIRK